MGIFSIPELPPLSISRVQEPVLEPPPPVARPENSPAHDETPGESYTPNDSSTEADPTSSQSAPESSEPSPPDPAHQINLFA